MKSTETPAVFEYQKALNAFRHGTADPSVLLKRMSELISLLDLTTTLNSRLSSQEILEAALLSVLGELQAVRGALYVTVAEGVFESRASRGLPSAAPVQISLPGLSPDEIVLATDGRYAEVLGATGLELLCPVPKGERMLAVLGLGPRADRRAYREEDLGFLRSVAACAAAPIENGLIHQEMERLNSVLSLKVFQLQNLFDISRELTATFDEEAIKNLMTTTLMGHLMVSRCALYLVSGTGLVLAHHRGPRSGDEASVVPEAAARPVLDVVRTATAVSDMPLGGFRDRLLRQRMALIVPLSLGSGTGGLAVIGERVSGRPFTDEDREFAQMLGRQALAALENVRLHRMRVDKQRQDRELQIARQIQQSLFPKDRPEIEGFEVAAISESCYEVGGDHYDFIPLPEGRLALVIADVSGKGTPASILMASVHAWLQALAGTTSPAALMERLNRFLLQSTQDNKYVTLIYAELDPATRRLQYVNAGHVPPYQLSADGSRRRLTAGGPVLGLLEDAAFEVGEVALEPGDLVTMVTDGASEALSPDDREFGDEGIFTALAAARPLPAEQALRALVEAVKSWAGVAGCTDDLTALVLKAL